MSVSRVRRICNVIQSKKEQSNNVLDCTGYIKGAKDGNRIMDEDLCIFCLNIKLFILMDKCRNQFIISGKNVYCICCVAASLF